MRPLFAFLAALPISWSLSAQPPKLRVGVTPVEPLAIAETGGV